MNIIKQIGLLPKEPGTYQFLDKEEKILYIGKAKNIQKRVKQHFQKQKNAPLKNLKMLEQVVKILCTQTENEVEALILENVLIKNHKPKYNILLRDDKNFLYVKITNEDFPQILFVRKINDKKSFYFGPYTSAREIRSSLSWIGKIFPYQCLSFFKKGVKNQACFNYHIHRCPGLCIGKISAEEYQKIIEQIKRFLRGDLDDIIKPLEAKMKEESLKRNFEKAAHIRDQLKSLQVMKERQTTVDPNMKLSQDIIAWTSNSKNLYVNIFKIQRGVLKGQEQYTFSLPSLELEDKEYGVHIIQQYYQNMMDIPHEIIIMNFDEDEKSTLETWLGESAKRKVSIRVPEKGKKHILMEMCLKNAQLYAQKQETVSTLNEGIHPEKALEELQGVLKLKKLPKRIECYDISHLAGKFTVASIVVFENGIPKRSDYRQMHIQSIGDKIDDYASMREALQRRLKYIVNKLVIKITKAKTPKESYLQKPDLIVLDGGKGQLSIGIEVLQACKLMDKIPIISLAKEQEDVFIPYQSTPILVDKRSQAQYLLERLRDETHRFGVSKNRLRRAKAEVASKLDEIPGIGPKFKKKLLQTFGSVENIKQASFEEVEKVVGKKTAEKVVQGLIG